jgi:hypothetical protein
MSRKQCKKCPWKVSTNPREILNGYCELAHRDLKGTIAEPGRFSAGALRVMACHETDVGDEIPCVGWLAHQLGHGNNIALRMAVMRHQIDADVELVGRQHPNFGATLPRKT